MLDAGALNKLTPRIILACTCVELPKLSPPVKLISTLGLAPVILIYTSLQLSPYAICWVTSASFAFILVLFPSRAYVDSSISSPTVAFSVAVFPAYTSFVVSSAAFFNLALKDPLPLSVRLTVTDPSLFSSPLAASELEVAEASTA